MRFMILVKASPESEAGALPDEEMLAVMGAYHEELSRAGVLLDGVGLKASAQGWRVRYGSGGQRTVVDGPFTETKELIAGYTLIQVRSRDEAMEWARRFPNPRGEGLAAEIEVRPVFEPDDFAPGKGIRRFRALEAVRN